MGQKMLQTGSLSELGHKLIKLKTNQDYSLEFIGIFGQEPIYKANILSLELQTFARLTKNEEFEVNIKYIYIYIYREHIEKRR